MNAPVFKIDVSRKEDAAARFDCERWRHLRRSDKTFSELWEMYESDRTFEDIGELLGVSRQAAEQMYERWFAEFQGTSEERVQRIRAKKLAAEQERVLAERRAEAESDEDFRYLADEARRRGLTLEPLVSYAGTGILKTNSVVYRAGDKYLRIYRRRTEFRPYKDAAQCYATFQVNLTTLRKVHAAVFYVDIPGYEKEVFVVRASFLRRTLSGKGKSAATFYIAIGPRKRSPIAGPELRKFKDAWQILDTRA